MSDVAYKIEPEGSDDLLNELLASVWENHEANAFSSILAHSLTYICAFDGPRLVGFVNVAWDGGIHGFILDTTVHGDYQRRGTGTELMKQAAIVATERGIEWSYVDFEPRYESFYRRCGYRRAGAGLLNLPQTIQRCDVVTGILRRLEGTLFAFLANRARLSFV